MAEKEWRVAAVQRLKQEVGGEEVEYPGRLAMCPRGHIRTLPTRFSKREFDLRCPECGRSYPFRDPAE